MDESTSPNQPMTEIMKDLIVQGSSFEAICDQIKAECERRNSDAYDTPEKVMMAILGMYCKDICVQRGYSNAEAHRKADDNYGLWRGRKKSK